MYHERSKGARASDSYGYGEVILFCGAFHRSMALRCSSTSGRQQVIGDYAEATVGERRGGGRGAAWPSLNIAMLVNNLQCTIQHVIDITNAIDGHVSTSAPSSFSFKIRARSRGVQAYMLRTVMLIRTFENGSVSRRIRGNHKSSDVYSTESRPYLKLGMTEAGAASLC
jgi:hypothetical protein